MQVKLVQICVFITFGKRKDKRLSKENSNFHRKIKMFFPDFFFLSTCTKIWPSPLVFIDTEKKYSFSLKAPAAISFLFLTCPLSDPFIDTSVFSKEHGDHFTVFLNAKFCFGSVLREGFAEDLDFFKEILGILGMQTPSHHKSHQQFQDFSSFPFAL